jgi:UDP-N-acetylmuramyl pentapeptide synthase
VSRLGREAAVEALDHIGQDGIESVEDILHIKALVAERVRRGGMLVLNADDRHLARLTEQRRVREPERNVVYFSLDEVEALRSEVGAMREGQVVVVYDKPEPVLKLLEECSATPASTLGESSLHGARQTAEALSALGA